MKLVSLQFLIDHTYVFSVNQYSGKKYYTTGAYALQYKNSHNIHYIQEFSDDVYYEIHTQNGSCIKCKIDSEVFELYRLVPVL